MSIKMDVSDFQVAYNILTGSAWQDIEDIQLLSQQMNPERLVIKKQEYENLSEEAKEIIHVILNAPTEILDELSSPVKNRVTMKRIRNFFQDRWNSQFIANIAIKEVIRWVNQL
jgi:hypothetical protein